MHSVICEVLNRNGKTMGFVQGRDYDECTEMAENFYGDNFYSLHKVTSYPNPDELKVGGTL